MPPSLRLVPVAEPIFVPAGTTCADAVAAARLPMTGPNAIVVARGPDGQEPPGGLDEFAARARELVRTKSLDGAGHLT